MSRYSSTLQEGLLGPPLSTHTGDTPDPLPPHLASREVASTMLACSGPSQLASFPFISLFSLGCREPSAALTILGPSAPRLGLPH